MDFWRFLRRYLPSPRESRRLFRIPISQRWGCMWNGPWLRVCCKSCKCFASYAKWNSKRVADWLCVWGSGCGWRIIIKWHIIWINGWDCVWKASLTAGISRTSWRSWGTKQDKNAVFLEWHVPYWWFVYDWTCKSVFESNGLTKWRAKIILGWIRMHAWLAYIWFKRIFWQQKAQQLHQSTLQHLCRTIALLG